MSDTESIDYGPLSEFIGIWRGNKGLVLHLNPIVLKTNSYYETISHILKRQLLKFMKKCLNTLIGMN